MKECIPFTDSGGEQVARAAMQWGLADMEPCDQIQPNIVVVSGHMTDGGYTGQGRQVYETS